MNKYYSYLSPSPFYRPIQLSLKFLQTLCKDSFHGYMISGYTACLSLSFPFTRLPLEVLHLPLPVPEVYQLYTNLVQKYILNPHLFSITSLRSLQATSTHAFLCFYSNLTTIHFPTCKQSIQVSFTLYLKSTFLPSQLFSLNP